jgi:hypothetical protein
MTASFADERSRTGQEGDARHVFGQLPTDLKDIWPRAADENLDRGTAFRRGNQ